SFEYKANNGSADSNAAQGNITITEPSAGPPPVKPAFTSPNTTTFNVGTPKTFTVTTTPVNPAVTVTKTSGTLPAGISFGSQPGTGKATLFGTAAPGTGGKYPLVFKATNAVGSTNQNFDLIVCDNIVVTNPATSTGTANSAFSQTFTQTGGSLPVTFSVGSGTLPAGLTLSAGGVLSGTPSQVGVFPITVKVTDTNGCTGVSATYNLTINCQTITVTNPATATGTAGAAFSQQ